MREDGHEQQRHQNAGDCKCECDAWRTDMADQIIDERA
jgi:hypothetical protein